MLHNSNQSPKVDLREQLKIKSAIKNNEQRQNDFYDFPVIINSW